MFNQATLNINISTKKKLYNKSTQTYRFAQKSISLTEFIVYKFHFILYFSVSIKNMYKPNLTEIKNLFFNYFFFYFCIIFFFLKKKESFYPFRRCEILFEHKLN